MGNGRAARGMAIFSAGLGLTELIAPQLVGKVAGVRNHAVLVRVLGARELASGAGLVALPKKSAGLWARFGGDIMDLALLGLAASSSSRKRGRLVLAGLAVIGVAALDYFLARHAESAAWRPAADPKARWRPAPA